MRMEQILAILVDLNCKVTFVADNLEYRQPYVTALQQLGVEVQFAPYVRSIPQFLGTRGGEFDVVMVSRHYIAIKHIDTLRSFAPRALIVFDTVDLHFLREERLADLHASPTARTAAIAKRDEELILIRKADLTLVVSTFEQELLGKLVPDSRVMVLSTIHEPLVGGKSFAEREGLVFIGGFRHPPNTDAVLWYAVEVLPRIRERLPGVKTYIIGSDPPPTIRSLAAQDLVIAGFVPDVTPYFTGCRISVSPLRYGAGVKGKVNLAMSHGLPVVATTPSIEGMHLTPEVDVLVADDPEAFADAVARAYSDKALWTRLAEGGRRQHSHPFLTRIGARHADACARVISRHRNKRRRLGLGPSRRGKPLRFSDAIGRLAPAEDQIPHAVAAGEAAAFELGQWPICGSWREIPCGVHEQGLVLQRCEHLDRVVLPIGSRMEIAAEDEAFGKRMHKRRLQQPPLVMPLLWPGVGEKYVYCRKRAGRDHALNDVHGVVGDDAHVGELRAVDQSQQAANARRMHVDREKIMIRLQRCDGSGCLAHAEADFQNLGIRSSELVREVDRGRRIRDAETWQQRVVGLTLRRGKACPAATRNCGSGGTAGRRSRSCAR